MSKPKRVRYSGVGVFSNQWILSRVQTVAVDTDLAEEEVRELTNPEVVEYAAQTPAVSVTIDTNEYASMRNLRSIAGGTATGATSIVDVTSFDGTTADISLMIEEDGVLERTMHVNDAFITSISWNFDVGGIATESFSLEADNKTWYLNDSGQTYTFTNVPVAQWKDDALAYNGAAYESGYFFFTSSGMETVAADFVTDYLPIIVYVDGIAQPTDGLTIITSGILYTDTFSHGVCWAIGSQEESGTRYRLVTYKDTMDATIPQAPETDGAGAASIVGGVTRGMIDIDMNTGGTTWSDEGSSNLLRIQTCSVDADLSREVLEELGHYRAYDRSLTYPVPVNITFSALASDLEEWFKFQGNDTVTEGSAGIGSFVKTAGLQIRIYDAKDTETTRNLLKTLTVTGLQVVSESFGVDVGGNATQDFTAKASNFALTGAGQPPNG